MTKRVLIFEPYPVERVGGNLRTLTYLLKHVDRNRFEEIVVSPLNTGFVKMVEALGVECLVVEPPPSINRWGGKALKAGFLTRVRSTIDMVRYNMRLAGLIRRRKINLIYANSIRAVLFTGLAARLTGTPLLWYIKGELDNPLLDRFGFAVSSRILFFCESNRDDKYPDLVAKYRDKIGIVKIGVDPVSITNAEKADKTALMRELDISPERINTVIVAQLFRPKGQHLAIEALQRIAQTYPNVRLYLMGDHVIEEYRGYRAELEAMIANAGLGDRVVFTGWRKDSLEVISCMDIVLHPSLSEGFGRAVLESMALGKPVVASRVGGLREIIKNGANGFSIEVGDVDALAAGWSALIADSELRGRLGAAARAEVQAGYLLPDKIAQLQKEWSALTRARD